MSAQLLGMTPVDGANGAEFASTAVREGVQGHNPINGFASAEAVYRSVSTLCDMLPPHIQKQLAVCFEWAREGIARQTSEDKVSPELQGLHAAYGYARDVMLATARKRSP